MKRVLVTGVGGVVGQGILRNIQSFDSSIYIVGTNVNQISAGNHLCNEMHVVPYAYDKGYIETMSWLSKKLKVDLIIPSTDYEAYYLGASRSSFDCPIAISESDVTKMSLDKYVNSEIFKRYNIAFAQSILPSNYQGEFNKCIVKPREGRGSRGIVLFPQNPRDFTDENVVQEYLDGIELTTTFYVKRNGEIHGLITFKRELEQGNTSLAEVVFEYDEKLLEIISSMVSQFKYRGSINLQSRVTSKGIIPFEINCRISGTNSLRSQFGFPDVAYTLMEYLYKKELPLPKVEKGVGLRVIKDIIYKGVSSEQIECKSSFYYY